ncbi:putative NAD(P)H-dependent D-xylose reductase [Triangularia verruculosa]|uniref:NAD(P)H-dependent D-xylose reductase n=1 Tax=Triangularia verruculosa TaxID=2587418 RepID=A0AAN6XPX5_9PEZI|nr:putative NAD(P)H-dependent D-xylose reductase [Triangularia verruculosa]
MLSIRNSFPRVKPATVFISSLHHQLPPKRHYPSRTLTTMSTTEPPPSLSKMPPLIYGTAWKKDRTADLVYEAIKAGFRAIDTAAMKKHYDEALVGEGIRRAISEGIVSRKDLWIQTKFTPYSPSPHYSTTSPIPTQLTSSITQSLQNLSTPDHSPPYLDALVLHSPFQTLAENTLAWSHLSSTFVPAQIHHLGISNCPPSFLSLFSSFLDENPSLCKIGIIQNRIRAAEYNWDIATRRFCCEKNIRYQGFWTLTGNVDVWRNERVVRDVRDGVGLGGLEEAWYALLMEGEGVTVLDGTTNGEHMRGDLEVVRKVREWRGENEKNEERWGRWVEEFRGVVGGSGFEGR